jgi:iron complex transport system permease protein
MNRQFKRFALVLSILIILLGAGIFFSFLVGSASISPFDIKDILLSPDSPDKSILLSLRLPRILLTITVGGALSLSGALLQGIFRNPLVEPYTLGIAGGSALFIAMVIVLKPVFLPVIALLPVAGFSGSLVTLLLLYLLSGRSGTLPLNELLLSGVMISFLCSSGLILLMAISHVEDLHSIIFWMMGSMERATWPLVWIMVAGSLVTLVISFFISSRLNALTLGEENAAHIGVPVESTKRTVFILASLLTGIAISCGGIIGFVGLIVPHLIRKTISADYRIILPASFFLGALFLLLCDTAVRTLFTPVELPVGVLTGLIGGSAFIIILSLKRKSS